MKHYLITGGTSGLGLDLVKKLYKTSKVSIIGRDFSKIDNQSNKKFIQNLNKVALDLRDHSLFNESLEECIKLHGPFDGFVHSGGILNVVPIKGLNYSLVEEMYKINVYSALMVLKFLRKKINHTKNCSVVLVSSIVHKAGNPGQAIYAGTKGALVSMAKSLALELKNDGIRINTVSPAAIETNMVFRYRKTVPVSALKSLKEKHPLGFGKPSDVSNMIVYLLSNKSKWVTGTDFIVDGGYSAQ